MSFAFEVTPEDVEIVMNQHGKSVSEVESRHLFFLFVSPEDYRIEKAALRGDDMETQTEYAYQEIAAILKEKGIL